MNNSEERMLSKWLSSVPVLALAFVSTVTLPGCVTSAKVTVQYRDQNGNSVGVEMTVSGTPPAAKPAKQSLNASVLFETREFDPSLLAPAADGLDEGTVTVNLANGQTVTYSQRLVLDTCTYVAPVTPGFEVAVYRPADVAALQRFIDQYYESAVNVTTTSNIDLENVNAGPAAVSTHVDVQANLGDQLIEVGSGFARVREVEYQQP